MDSSEQAKAASATAKNIRAKRWRGTGLVVVVVAIVVAVTASLLLTKSSSSKALTGSGTSTPTPTPSPTSAPIPALTPAATWYLKASDYPFSAMAIAADGYIYVASDRAIYRQLQDLTSGLELYAGSATVAGGANGPRLNARFSQIVGLAAVGTRLNIAEHESHAIRVLEIIGSESDAVSVVAGAVGSSDYVDGALLSARFGSVSSFASNGSALFIVDASASKIRTISLSQSTVSTFSSVDMTNWVSAITFTPTDELYFANECAIYLVSADGKTTTIQAGAVRRCRYADSNNGTDARFDGISSLALSPSGDALYIAVAGNDCLRRLDIASKSVTTAAGVCVSSNPPFDGSGSWLPTAGDASTGSASTANITFTAPTGLAFNAAGVVFASDTEPVSGKGRVRHVHREMAFYITTALRGLVPLTAIAACWFGVGDVVHASSSTAIYDVQLKDGASATLTRIAGDSLLPIGFVSRACTFDTPSVEPFEPQMPAIVEMILVVVSILRTQWLSRSAM